MGTSNKIQSNQRISEGVKIWFKLKLILTTRGDGQKAGTTNWRARQNSRTPQIYGHDNLKINTQHSYDTAGDLAKTSGHDQKAGTIKTLRTPKHHPKQTTAQSTKNNQTQHNHQLIPSFTQPQPKPPQKISPIPRLPAKPKFPTRRLKPKLPPNSRRTPKKHPQNPGPEPKIVTTPRKLARPLRVGTKLSLHDTI